MRPWLVILAGPLAWLAHFTGLYGLASLQALGADIRPAAMVAFSLGCAGAAACLMIVAARRARSAPDEPALFLWRLSAAASLVGLLGIMFQTAAAVLA